MKKKIFLLISSLCSVSFATLLPATPESLTVSNAATFTLNGLCNRGGGDVDVSFGLLNFTVPCGDVLGAYKLSTDVSAETATNPILHCVSQPPTATVCSRPVDNALAPPGGSFDITPLPEIDSENVASYAVSGSCAPSGASLSLNLGAVTGVISGTCPASNTFSLVGDVSSVVDGVGLLASLEITSGTTTTIATTVNKNTAAASPFPTVVAVTSTFTDADLDSWLEVGDSAVISVQFSESVNLVGGVELDIAIFSGQKSLSYLSGSGTDTLNFSMPILANDEQCNGLVTIRGIDLNGGSIESVATGESASYTLLSSDVQIEKIDTVAPVLSGTLSLDVSQANLLKSPIFSNVNLQGYDNCVATRLQASIGESVGGTEVTPFLDVPSDAVSSYQIEDGVDGYSFLLLTNTFYYINLQALDGAGSAASLSSASWQISPIFSIPNLIVHLDAADAASVLDGAGEPSDSGAFDGFVDSIADISGSTNVHDFTAFSGTQEPAFNALTNALEFDGVNDCMETPNQADINTVTVDQRSFSGVFTLGADVATRQMIFEEGGATRGMNIYVDTNVLYCGFWNVADDGDGAQAFVSQSVPITAGQTYNITSVFDYTNYSGPAGPNGNFDCYVNGVAMGASIPITSRLFAHTGDVSIGCSGDSTRLHTGNISTREYSSVSVHEFVMFNTPPDAATAFMLHTYLQSKWGY